MGRFMKRGNVGVRFTSIGGSTTDSYTGKFGYFFFARVGILKMQVHFCDLAALE
jgi:hypothetical protein